MNFTFTDEEIQLIVNVLAQRPYGEVFNLMNNIQRQAAQQKQPQPQLVPGPTQQELAA
ncbi:MAG TPA: hypothetical protein VIY56_17090 [Vicinamibacterales bacterium]